MRDDLNIVVVMTSELEKHMPLGHFQGTEVIFVVCGKSMHGITNIENK